MTSSTQRARDIFLDAIEIGTPEARAAHLDTACAGDAELRRRVEILLSAHERPESLLDQGVVIGAGATVSQPPDDPALSVEGPGSLVGPYRLTERLGEGGMGIVFRAEQTTPVRRSVALKLIKPGMDSRQVLARFEAERQALVLMDHPHIAKVLDAGATGQVRPYFVMELVQGSPITKYCDEHRLTPRQRLELFVPVCQAIQHAHQKGVIHRDIKPSNVLVVEIDGRPVPKVIDFGVAKAIDQPLAERTAFTRLGFLVGTPEYMSPEQTGAGPDIDTRSDVYSLGVLLYELLTGTTPLDRGALRSAGLDEILKRVREDESPKPSTRLSGTDERLLSVAAQRATEPTRLVKLVRGDLDWVVMKAIDKDRGRRYETANALARDLRRHLDGDPVEACPPSSWYRFRKFASRHRAGLSTTALVALALVAGSTVSLWQAVLARQQADRALRAEEAARAQSERARQAEALALAQRDRARKAVDSMYTQVAEKWLSRQPRMRPLQRQFLEEALDFYQRFATETGSSPEARHELALAAHRVGNILDALGRLPEANDAHRRAIVVLDQLCAERPEVPEHRVALVDCWLKLGWLDYIVGRADGAIEKYRIAMALSNSLVDEFPDNVEYLDRQSQSLMGLGNAAKTIGRFDDAEKAYRRAELLWEPLLGQPRSRLRAMEGSRLAYHDLGSLYRQIGRGNDGEREFSRALAVGQQLLGIDPTSFAFRGRFASDLEGLAECLQLLGRWDEARGRLLRAIEIQERMVIEDPDFTAYREDLALALGQLAKVSRHEGRRDEASQYLRRSIGLLEELLVGTPDLLARRLFIASAMKDLALLERERSRHDDARKLLASAHVHAQAGLKINPLDPELRQLAAEIAALQRGE